MQARLCDLGSVCIPRFCRVRNGHRLLHFRWGDVSYKQCVVNVSRCLRHLEHRRLNARPLRSNLANNQLSGSIPSSIGSLTALVDLRVPSLATCTPHE